MRKEREPMNTQRRLLAVLVASMFVISGIPKGDSARAGSSVTDGPLTDRVYVRHDGGTDPVIQACGDDADPFAGGNRQQNEPTVAINPVNSNVIVAGANDFCTQPTTTDFWLGFYVSTDGGQTWIDSLNPGYPGDTSAEGESSPIFGEADGTADPQMAWDNQDSLYYGGLSFKRDDSDPAAFSDINVILSTWTADPSQPLGMDFIRTVVVSKGTLGQGRFNDRPSLEVDDWDGSPHEGNVYVAWSLFNGSSSEGIYFSRSTDQGQTFSKPVKISQGFGPHGSDIAIAPDGSVYVVWRRFAFLPQVDNEIQYVKSTDGGKTFGQPHTIAAIIPSDRSDLYESDGAARDCGDGLLLCASGFVFHRIRSFPRATADRSGAVYVAWEQATPAADNGDTYRPDGQSQVVVARSSDGGATWSAPTAPDPQPLGHQWWPNLTYDPATDKLALIYFDSREDSSYSVNRPPGNLADGTSVCGVPIGTQVCDVLNTFIATSLDGITWTSTKISSMGHQPEYELFGIRPVGPVSDEDVPFHGDYLGITAARGTIYGVWTDNRDVMPGEDVRETVQVGFDVLQCRSDPSAPDECPNAGGLNQNIYGAAMH
jgi:hypothetical protein